MNRRQAILSTILGALGISCAKLNVAKYVFPEVAVAKTVKNYSFSRQWIMLKDGSSAVKISGFILSSDFTDIQCRLSPGFRRESMSFSTDGRIIDFTIIDVPIGSVYERSKGGAAC